MPLSDLPYTALESVPIPAVLRSDMIEVPGSSVLDKIHQCELLNINIEVELKNRAPESKAQLDRLLSDPDKSLVEMALGADTYAQSVAAHAWLACHARSMSAAGQDRLFDLARQADALAEGLHCPSLTEQQLRRDAHTLKQIDIEIEDILGTVQAADCRLGDQAFVLAAQQRYEAAKVSGDLVRLKDAARAYAEEMAIFANGRQYPRAGGLGAPDVAERAALEVMAEQANLLGRQIERSDLAARNANALLKVFERDLELIKSRIYRAAP